ncbi:hypothetical protein BLA29_012037 [Euroglyphus maynei]|uniref:Uncharacterized protein n=1 Tax=Euroglyphus maynei TaxID=6958 RepID=A0A1Y3ATA7_EURMA|nr:hypothetical protein BLA29_012037 [Euroglyphus maynei]
MKHNGITLPPLTISKQTRCPTGYVLLNENPDYNFEFERKVSNGFVDGPLSITKTTSLNLESPFQSSSLSIQQKSPLLYHNRRNSSILRKSKIDQELLNHHNGGDPHLQLRLPILNNNNVVSPFYNNG